MTPHEAFDTLRDNYTSHDSTVPSSVSNEILILALQHYVKTSPTDWRAVATITAPEMERRGILVSTLVSLRLKGLVFEP